MFNRCGVTGDEYYKLDDNCALVNEDGSLNYDNEFVNMEFGYNEKAYKARCDVCGIWL